MSQVIIFQVSKKRWRVGKREPWTHDSYVPVCSPRTKDEAILFAEYYEREEKPSLAREARFGLKKTVELLQAELEAVKKEYDQQTKKMQHGCYDFYCNLCDGDEDAKSV